MVSDLHLAKAEHFRSKGLGRAAHRGFSNPWSLDLAPQGTPARAVGAARGLVSLVHPTAPGRSSRLWLSDEFDNGLKDAILVRGNHDRAHDATYEDMGLVVVDSWAKSKVWC